jgi:hypothetical protein
MRKLALVGLVAMSASVAASGPHPLRPHDLATGPYQAVATTAYTGTLMYEGGCLLFRDDENSVQFLPVWPYGSVFNGTFVTFHRPGRMEQRIVVGEEFQIEGQPVAWQTLSAPAYQPYQRQCGSPAFSVSRVRPGN